MGEEKITIWRLIKNCAEQLTNSGQTPFTRKDLIRCIQRSHPEYGDNSINPIIQGVTNNLKGGANGAIGKNILISVGRGKFELNRTVPNVSNIKNKNLKKPENDFSISKAQIKRRFSSVYLDNYNFLFVCNIEPEKCVDGQVQEYYPQDRYDASDGIKLSKYGKGPFCKFRIPRALNFSGVYALFSDDVIKYIGECAVLSSRYNAGYGNISPRNCYLGGQDTNCRINNLILNEVKSGRCITLWFYETKRNKEIESILRKNISPEWNRI